MKFYLSHTVTVLLALTWVSASIAQTTLPTSGAAWFQQGQQALSQAKRRQLNLGPAKNVILFVGDGMGVSTVTAARILDGKLQGTDGEFNRLSFERFPYLAHAVTASFNQQIPDSAPPATAMVTGIKANDGASTAA